MSHNPLKKLFMNAPSEIYSKQQEFLQIVVLHYLNFEDTTKQCLDSLLPQVIELNMTPIVVDNGSTDKSLTSLASYRSLKSNAFHIHHIPTNIGFSGGMNAGVNLCNSEWILLVSNDIVFANNSLHNLIATIRALPENVGIIGPLTNNAGNSQCIHVEGNTKEQILANATHITNNPNQTWTTSYRADFCCIAIRRDLWEKLGGLDKAFGQGYYEDFDFSMRAKKMGYLIAVAEDSFVYHAGSQTLKQTSNIKALLKKNKKIFKRKHPDAQFIHRRMDNLNAIIQLKNLTNIPSYQARLAQLKDDIPKGLIKKIIWRCKIYLQLNQ